VNGTDPTTVNGTDSPVVDGTETPGVCAGMEGLPTGFNAQEWSDVIKAINDMIQAKVQKNSNDGGGNSEQNSFFIRYVY
jgi:hypothetical protein